jgi:hypothetical protein
MKLKWYNDVIIIALLLGFVLFSCEEELPPEDLNSDITLTSSGKASYNSLNLFWTEFTGENFDRYELYYKSIYDKEYKLYEAIKFEKQTFTTVYRLEPATIYLFYVKVLDTKGKSYQTETCQIETYPDKPTIVKLYEINDQYSTHYSSLIKWSPYIDYEIIDFAKYEIHKSTLSEFFVTSPSTLVDSVKNMNDTSMVINGLEEGTKYYFKVRTYNALGKYTESNFSAITTAFKPPDTVLLFEPVEVTESSITVKFSKCKSKYFSSYSIQVGDNYTFTYGFTSVGSTKDTIITIKSLKKWGEYFARVLVTDSRKLTSASNVIDFTATYGGMPVPVVVSVVSVGKREIILEWTEPQSKYIPSGPDKSQPFPFAVLMSTSIIDDPEYMPGIGQTKDQLFVIEGLKPGTEYFFRVRFTNLFGKYSFSKLVSAKTLPK